MTVVAGYTNGKEFAIAADSGAFEESSSLKMTMAGGKVWATAQTLQGGAGNARVIEVARRANLDDPYQLATVLLDANIAGEWSVLVVTQKRLYEIGEDGSVFRFKEPYCAVGAAAPIAIGALATGHRKRMGSPEQIVRLALDVSVQHSSLCSTPVSVLSK